MVAWAYRGFGTTIPDLARVIIGCTGGGGAGAGVVDDGVPELVA